MATFPTVFRQRILDAALRGDATEQAVADRFAVSRAFVQKIKRQVRRTGSVEPVGHRGGAPRKLSDDDRAALVAWIDETNDATCDDLATRLASERGVAVSHDTVGRALARGRVHAQKKTFRAAERDRDDVAEPSAEPSPRRRRRSMPTASCSSTRPARTSR